LENTAEAADKIEQGWQVLAILATTVEVNRIGPTVGGHYSRNRGSTLSKRSVGTGAARINVLQGERGPTSWVKSNFGTQEIFVPQEKICDLSFLARARQSKG